MTTQMSNDALRTESYFQERIARGDRAAFRRILKKAGTEPPRVDDELPEHDAILKNAQSEG